MSKKISRIHFKKAIVRKALSPFVFFTMILFISSFLVVNYQLPATRLAIAPPGALRPATNPGSSDPTQDEWPMIGGQLNRTGEAHTTPMGGAGPLWERLLGVVPTNGGMGYYTPTPIIAGECVYINGNCLNATTGAFLWSSTMCDDSPTVADGRLYIGGSCLNATTGRVLWSSPIGGSFPAVAGGRLYVVRSNSVCCLNATTGTFLWNSTTGSAMGYSPPAVVGGRIYVSSNTYGSNPMGQQCCCLNATTGELLWNSTLGNSYGCSSSVVADGHVYVASDKFYCLNATNGGLIWNITLGSGSYGGSSPAVAGGRLYVVRSNSVYCLNATTGKPLWGPSYPGCYIAPSLAVLDERIYVGCYTIAAPGVPYPPICCLNAFTGGILWRWPLGGCFYPVWTTGWGSPAVADGCVYAFTCNATAAPYSLYSCSIVCLPCILDNTPPTTATITSPSIGVNISGIITITANAVDNVGGSGVKNVTFWRDGISTGTYLGEATFAPYSINWMTTTASDGVHTLQIRVFDKAGNYLDSSSTFVSVDITPPSLASITSPTASAYVRGTIWINATAADATSGIKNVTFYRDAMIVIGTDTTVPYTIQWNTIGFDGVHTLFVRAFDYANNYLGEMNQNYICVTVDSTSPSTTTVITPWAGDYVKGTIWVNGVAADACTGIKNITFYRDAAVLIGTKTMFPEYPWEPGYNGIQWDTMGLDGAHTLYARAFDRAGNYLDSATVAITVDNTAPSSASVTNPTGGAIVRGTIWVNATAADATSGINNVNFYRDAGTLIGTDATAPYATSWNTTLVGDGSHTLYVRAFDRTGNYYDSVGVTVWVNNTSPTFPSAPENLQASAGNQQINLTWQSPSSDGGSAITNYRIYRGTSLGNESSLTIIGNVLTYLDTNMTNGQAYYYKISAINMIGEGPFSIETHSKPATVPNAPQTLLIRVRNGKIVLSWEASANNGGASIVSYKIYRGTSPDNETYLVTIGNITSFTDTHLVNWQSYYYRISAVNAMGESLWSAEVVAMVYVSENGNQIFNLIIVLLSGAVVLAVSGFIIHYNRKMKRLESEITKLSLESQGKKAPKPWKAHLTEGENQINQLPIGEEKTEGLRPELHGIENEASQNGFRSGNGILSESEAKSLWDALMLRFKRLYKLEKWKQALILLETLFEIAKFLGDQEKFNDLSDKYDEIQKKSILNN